MLDRMEREDLRAQIEGFIVSPMCLGGVEVICGTVRDPVFGPIVMLGLGGVFVEVLGDVTFRLAPIGNSEAKGMIDELRGAKAADFDNRYLSQQVDAHNEALILMQGYAKDGDVAPVKAFANDTAGAVQMHLNMAQQLYDAKK